jgi:hypothetical protein
MNMRQTEIARTQMRKDYCSVLTRQEGAIEMQPNLHDLE